MSNNAERAHGNLTKVLVIHGPNLDLLGRREPALYGAQTLNEINKEFIQYLYARGFQTKIVYTCRGNRGYQRIWPIRISHGPQVFERTVAE